MDQFKDGFVKGLVGGMIVIPVADEYSGVCVQMQQLPEYTDLFFHKALLQFMFYAISA